MKKSIIMVIVVLMVVLSFGSKYNQRTMDVSRLIKQGYVIDPEYVFFEDYMRDTFTLTQVNAINNYMTLMILQYVEELKDGKKPAYALDEVMGWGFGSLEGTNYDVGLGKKFLENYYSTDPNDVEFNFHISVLLDYLEYRLSQEFLDKSNVPYDDNWETNSKISSDHLNLIKLFLIDNGDLQVDTPIYTFYISNVSEIEELENHKKKFGNVSKLLTTVHDTESHEKFQEEVIELIDLSTTTYMFFARVHALPIAYDLLAFLDEDLHVLYIMVTTLTVESL